MVKDFIIGNIFEKIDTLKIKGKANDFPTEPTGDYVLPLLTAGVENQGLARYAKRTQCPTILSNCISVSANGANSGTVFYHPEEFAVLQDAYAIKVKNYIIPDETIGLYLAASLHKAIASTHDWNYKAGWNRIKEDIVSLPVKTDKNGNPVVDDKHKYHNEGFIPDFEYMEKYIEKFEQERIEELERYLVATGLNDYELTNEDIEILSLSGLGNHKESNREDAVKTHKEMRKFKCGDLFTSQTGDTDLQQKDINGKGTIFINSGVENNGIKGMTDRPAKIFSKNTISIDFWGNAYYRDFEYKMATHNHVFSLSGDCIKNELVGLYIVSQMKYITNLFSYGNMGTWTKIKKLFVLLPIQTNNDNNPVIDETRKYHPDGYIPDWDFMEKYIKAIEKIVIADVVKFKDTVINRTKEVVN